VHPLIGEICVIGGEIVWSMEKATEESEILDCLLEARRFAGLGIAAPHD
jgi:hypothetical protein